MIFVLYTKYYTYIDDCMRLGSSKQYLECQNL